MFISHTQIEFGGYITAVYRSLVPFAASGQTAIGVRFRAVMRDLAHFLMAIVDRDERQIVCAGVRWSAAAPRVAESEISSKKYPQRRIRAV